jgi:hypothetical protein
VRVRGNMSDVIPLSPALRDYTSVSLMVKCTHLLANGAALRDVDHVVSLQNDVSIFLIIPKSHKRLKLSVTEERY